MTTSSAAALDLAALRPADAVVERHRRAGYWHDTTLLTDLDRWAREMPDAVAVVAQRRDGSVQTLSYAELADAVDRGVAALRGLGVGPGVVVSIWMPTRWELIALLLACWKAGAVASPMMPTFGPREVERMIARVGATVGVTVDSADGVDHGAALARMATRLPALRHQVVLGAAARGQVSFTDRFGAAAPEPAPPASGPADPDSPALVLFTSGTTGDPKAVVHTLDTVTSGMTACRDEYRIVPGTVLFTPHTLSHAGGINLLVASVTGGATIVVTEQWNRAAAATLIESYRVTLMMAAPVYLEDLLHATADAPPALRDVFAIGMAPPAGLVDACLARWQVPLRTYWAMTEVNGMFTRPGDPPDRAAHSIGRPASGLEVDLVPAGADPPGPGRPARLRVRGPSVCLATADRDGGPVRIVAEHDDGWYETGDLAAPDGHGGYTLWGRVADRVGGAFMVPTSDVEDVLRTHPRIVDAAVIETYEGEEPVPCAVVMTSAGAALGLEEVRAFLLEQHMTEWYLPRRLETVGALPRNAMGKVAKAALRATYAAPP